MKNEFQLIRMYTPECGWQVIEPGLLAKGFELVERYEITLGGIWRLFWIRIVESCLNVKFIAKPDFIHFCLWHGREGLEVTDDVSIVEYLKHPVFITQGSYTNLKVSSHTPVQEFSVLQILCNWNYVSEMRTFILGMFSDSVWYALCNHIGPNNCDCMLIKMTLSFCWQVTTPDDLLVAERILHQTAPQEVVKAVST